MVVLTREQTTTNVHISARTVAKASIERKYNADSYFESTRHSRICLSGRKARYYSDRHQCCLDLGSAKAKLYLRILEETSPLIRYTSDLLNRHRTSHENAEQSERSVRRRTEKACQACIRSKTKCEEERPCKVRIPLRKIPSTKFLVQIDWSATFMGLT